MKINIFLVFSFLVLSKIVLVIFAMICEMMAA